VTSFLKVSEDLEMQSTLESLAIELIKQQQFQKAAEIYEKLLELKTNNPIVFVNLAVIFGIQGRWSDGIPLLRTALQLRPSYPEAYNNLGIALQEQNQLDDAINSFKNVLQLKPSYPEAHNNLGNALQKQCQLDKAIASFAAAIHLKPDYPEAHNNLGTAFQEMGLLDAAITSFVSAIQIRQNYPEAYNNLGNALQDKGYIDAAICSYKTAILLNHNYTSAHYNLGNALEKNCQLHAAIASYVAAIKLNPNYAEAHNNLGGALQEQGHLGAAIASFSTAIKLRRDYTDAQCNLSHAMLLARDYKNGWEKYEYRLRNLDNMSGPHAQPNGQKWDGKSPDPCIPLLVVSEQGLGDTLQFMRYVTVLRDRGFSVSFCAQPRLHTLIQSSGIDLNPLTPKEANETFNHQWIPLLSIPRHLEVNPENPVYTGPYISSTDEHVIKWRRILAKKQHSIIAINWQGNPRYEDICSRGRSLPLEKFASIAKLKNIKLLSVQKGFGSEQLETCSFKDRFVSCQHQINDTWDFLETAAIVANCDLVITSDTSVAHLAGGMGKSTWLLLKRVPEWRWGLEGDTTFWYPSMRLFRQTKSGNWDEVMERVAAELQRQF